MFYVEDSYFLGVEVAMVLQCCCLLSHYFGAYCTNGLRNVILESVFVSGMSNLMIIVFFCLYVRKYTCMYVVQTICWQIC